MRPNALPPLLLDTHVWLWLVNGQLEQKSLRACKDIQKHLDRNSVYVSAISMWEVAMLEARRRIILPIDCMIWIKRALGAPGIELEELSPEIAVASTRLPGEAPRDPADRMIIASAMSLGAVLTTCDQEMAAYAEKHGLPFLTF